MYIISCLSRSLSFRGLKKLVDQKGSPLAHRTARSISSTLSRRSILRSRSHTNAQASRSNLTVSTVIVRNQSANLYASTLNSDSRNVLGRSVSGGSSASGRTPEEEDSSSSINGSWLVVDGSWLAARLWLVCPTRVERLFKAFSFRRLRAAAEAFPASERLLWLLRYASISSSHRS